VQWESRAISVESHTWWHPMGTWCHPLRQPERPRLRSLVPWCVEEASAPSEGDVRWGSWPLPLPLSPSGYSGYTSLGAAVLFSHGLRREEKSGSPWVS
jgi:hypothetical protein